VAVEVFELRGAPLKRERVSRQRRKTEDAAKGEVKDASFFVSMLLFGGKGKMGKGGKT